LSNGNVGQWNTENAGIQCNESNQVTSIRLSNNHLQGKIPSEIKVFSSLGILDQKSNDISGSLPASLLHLPLLRRADLSHNVIVGELPVSIVNATSLESLILRESSLNGTLPSPIGQGTALKDLDLFLVGNEVSGSLNFLCAPDRQFDILVSSTCDANVSMPCDCCTHCCDSTATNCVGL
jgi:Leucine-rich repeat (LRR) protein